jgi:hypothetical protein
MVVFSAEGIIRIIASFRQCATPTATTETECFGRWSTQAGSASIDSRPDRIASTARKPRPGRQTICREQLPLGSGARAAVHPDAGPRETLLTSLEKI